MWARSGSKLPGLPRGSSPIKPDGCAPAGLKYLREMARHRGSAVQAQPASLTWYKKVHTLYEILDDQFAHYLTLPVRAIRLESRCFWNWDHRRRSVYGRGGRVYETSAVELGHDLKEEYRRGDVVVVICYRDLGRLPNGLVGLFGATWMNFRLGKM